MIIQICYEKVIFKYINKFRSIYLTALPHSKIHAFTVLFFFAVNTCFIHSYYGLKMTLSNVRLRWIKASNTSGPSDNGISSEIIGVTQIVPRAI